MECQHKWSKSSFQRQNYFSSYGIIKGSTLIHDRVQMWPAQLYCIFVLCTSSVEFQEFGVRCSQSTAEVTGKEPYGQYLQQQMLRSDNKLEKILFLRPFVRTTELMKSIS